VVSLPGCFQIASIDLDLYPNPASFTIPVDSFAGSLLLTSVEHAQRTMVHPDQEARRRQIRLRQYRKEAARAVGVLETVQMQAIHERFVNGRPRVVMGSLGFTDDALRT
jgi:hypothetical protein